MATMGRPRLTFSFTYESIAELCGISTNAVSKAVARDLVDPEDMLSVACYLAAHGTEEARMEIMQAMIRSGDYVYRGRPKPAATRKSKK